MKVKVIKIMVNWMKRISGNEDTIDKKNQKYCPNFATRCCVTCNKCWDKKE